LREEKVEELVAGSEFAFEPGGNGGRSSDMVRVEREPEGVMDICLQGQNSEGTERDEQGCAKRRSMKEKKGERERERERTYRHWRS
jgi:hypothetical protein